MEEEYKQHLKEKSDWHTNNMSLVASYFENICQECKEKTSNKNGVVHHYKYTGHDYKKSVEKLISYNSITWLCKKCHEKMHIAFTKDEVDFRMKHSGFCAICEKFEWHAWFKLGDKSNYVRQQAPLCNKCVKNLLQIGLLEEKVEKYRNDEEYKVIILSKDYNIEDKILKPILTKLNKKTFGKKDENIKNSKQINIFDTL